MNILPRLPHHTPHREARFRRAEKILYTSMLETHLVKELVYVPPTPANQHRNNPQRMEWREHDATIGPRWRGTSSEFGFPCIFRGGKEVSHHVTVEDRRVAGIALGTSGTANTVGEQRMAWRTDVGSQH